MDILVEAILWPFVGFLEAIAGVLWPSEDPKVRRIQRICLVVLLAGCIAAAGAVILALFFPSRHIFTLIAVAAVCFIVSGILGNKVEKLFEMPDTARANEIPRLWVSDPAGQALGCAWHPTGMRYTGTTNAASEVNMPTYWVQIDAQNVLIDIDGPPSAGSLLVAASRQTTLTKRRTRLCHPYCLLAWKG